MLNPDIDIVFAVLFLVPCDLAFILVSVQLSLAQSAAKILKSFDPHKEQA